MIATRQDDELVLEVLKRMIAGASSVQISRSLGKNDTWARTTFNRILEDDMADSGENPAKVRAAYRKEPRA